MPIILGSNLLRKLVNFYEERAKNGEYSTTTTLLESSLRQIKEAKENLLELYREIRDEYTNCKDTSEKSKILAEIHQIEKESQLHTAIAEANELIVIFGAKLTESEKTRATNEFLRQHTDLGVEEEVAPTTDALEIIPIAANMTEQNRNFGSLQAFSQASYSSQNRCSPVASHKKEIAAMAYSDNRLGQKNNGRVIQSRAKHTYYRPNYGTGCIFSHKGNHSSVRCRTVSDKRMRRKALKAQNRCWKCFSPNHNSFVCHKQDCSFCGQKHHISLCLKKHKPQLNNGNKRRTRDTVINCPDPRDSQNCGLESNDGQSGCRKSKSTNTQMCMCTLTGSNLCVGSSMSEQLVLMTAEGSIWNARKQQYEKILFVFDSGAQKTVIDERLVQQFGLPKHMTEKCSISGIGGRTETFDSHFVPLKIVTAFGEEIEITVQTRPVITEGFPSVRLEQCDVAFLKANEIFLANTKLRGELQIPRVLVGLDYYHDLVTHIEAKTPSGLHVAKTVFGHTIYGRGLSSVSQSNSVSYNLTAICEKTEHQALPKISELRKPVERRKGENLHKYSDFEHNCSVAVRKLRSQRIQPSAVNRSRRRPALHAKPPSTPSSRHPPPTPAARRRPPRHQAVLRNRLQDVNPRRTTTTRKKAKNIDPNSNYCCRSPQYHRRLDDPFCILNHQSYRTSCGVGGADPRYACYDTY
ncbi:hypothetical protein Y032_0176g555 [Ancylostoma ceylanicum]|uniref:Peptidase A2 domain-containing protein n=1 Tax=Ancylostoma ceylanicum TaxID=53326 RepID=A0A016SU79_9BILA|nr:hypothetical protein Y032_0176g555 [Ancylostoma ceylanicum]